MTQYDRIIFYGRPKLYPVDLIFPNCLHWSIASASTAGAAGASAIGASASDVGAGVVAGAGAGASAGAGVVTGCFNFIRSI